MNVQDLLRKFESSQENKEQCPRGKSELTKSNSFCHGFNNGFNQDADETHSRVNGIGKRKCIHEEILNSKPVAGPIVVKSKAVENGTHVESSQRQPKNNIYGTINSMKSSSADVNNQTGVNNNNNNIAKSHIQMLPVAPKKPPRTFAHDIYLRQKNCQTASPEVRKPAPPPKPSFYQTPAVAAGSFRDRKYSMPQKLCAAKPAARPSTPPPPRPPSGAASSRTQWFEATNTIPRSSKGRSENKSKEATKDRGCISKHIYDEPATETGPLRYPNNNYCHVANGNLHDKPDKPRDLHYMSTPVYVQKNYSEFPNCETGAWRANNDNDTADNVKSPTKKGFNLVRDVVNWSVSCIGQPMAPSS